MFHHLRGAHTHAVAETVFSFRGATKCFSTFSETFFCATNVAFAHKRGSNVAETFYVMVAELLSHPKRQFYLSFITKIPGDTLLTKMAAELPSIEQIFTETGRLVPLKYVHLIISSYKV